MPRTNEDLEKVTLRLKRSQVERVRSFYPRVSYNEAIRNIIEAHLRLLESKLDRDK